MGNESVRGTFLVCEKCGKRLIERNRNGLFHFIFGKPIKDGNCFVPVEMYIQGNVKIKCLRRTCGHWNVLNYFPSIFNQEVSPSEADCTGNSEKKL
jgi:hypothetical protein